MYSGLTMTWTLSYGYGVYNYEVKWQYSGSMGGVGREEGRRVDRVEDKTSGHYMQYVLLGRCTYVDDPPPTLGYWGRKENGTRTYPTLI